MLNAISQPTYTAVSNPATARAANQAEHLSRANIHDKDEGGGELREAFDQFVGETFFRQLISEMRKTTGEPAYFHGGRAEEVFQGQLDTIMAENLSKAGAKPFSDAMFGLFEASLR